jgi:hypothetical protein
VLYEPVENMLEYFVLHEEILVQKISHIISKFKENKIGG